MTDHNLLKMKGITKKYPGVTALDNVDFSLKHGEVHALVGENGAGKSTLIKVLMGIERKDAGSISINGKSVEIHNAQDAAAHKIASVFQELSLIPDLTVGENVFLTRMKKSLILNRKKMFKDTADILKEYGIELNPRSAISDLSAARRQLAEIVKAIAIKPNILVLDEPTASLTEDEVEKLFSTIRIFKEAGIGIIYISHRMNELEIIADRITVLRDGKYIATRDMNDITTKELVSMMVGREVDLHNDNKENPFNYDNPEKAMEIKKLGKKGTFKDISFNLYKGEVLGIAGLVGSGRSELMNLIFGVEQSDSGQIIINGKVSKINNVQDALKNKIAMVPESRHQQGLVLMHSVADNISLPVVKRFQKWGILRESLKQEFAQKMIDIYKVKTDSPRKIVNYLSGGNQQKVVVAKWLAIDPEILIVDEPTAGVDVGSKAEIHKLIKSLIKKGLSVIMISSEMPELLAYSDRIMVMNDNKILGILKNPSQEEIMNIIMEDKSNIAKKNIKEVKSG